MSTRAERGNPALTSTRGQNVSEISRQHIDTTLGGNDNHSPPPTISTGSPARYKLQNATPPIEIPSDGGSLLRSGSPSPSTDSYMDRFMRGRKTSISFSDEVMTDSGERRSIDKPLQKPVSHRQGGRSMMDVFAQARAHRSHSESNRDHFDPMTGRHLPRFSKSPPREEPHVGEGRFPMLQDTVDDMARESQTNLLLTTDATELPGRDEAHTPKDDHVQYSPLSMTRKSGPQPIPTSEDSPRPFRRTASERWKSGETAQDFFSQARNSRKNTGSWRNLRRDTTSSTKSPSSVASSFLRGFSLGSGGDDSNVSGSADAEGETIGDDYVLGKQIGFGGFSIIREVTQLSAETGQQRKLAAKIVQRNIDGKSEAENELAQTEFEHEVELWRFLSHPNILPLEAVYKLEQATFCFIPLNTGGTLFDLIRRNRGGISLDLARNYSYQLASALQYLHLDARVVHRDVKLENCLLDLEKGEPGLVRVCDFGMAEWIQGENSTSRSSNGQDQGMERRKPKFIGPADSSTAAFAGGSLEYAAPEIVQRATSSQDCDGTPAGKTIVSPAVDIWAFGVCLFTLIMGKRPFSDSFLPRVVMAILAGEWDKEAMAIKLGNDPEAQGILELLEGCLDTDERQRWRIREVIECQWFAPERQKHDDNPDNCGWRL